MADSTNIAPLMLILTGSLIFQCDMAHTLQDMNEKMDRIQATEVNESATIEPVATDDSQD